MSTTPAFASTPLTGSAIAPSTNDTSLTAPSNVSVLVTAGANGARIDFVRIYGVGTTVAGRLNIFRYDGSHYWLVDSVLIIAITPSTTQLVFNQTNAYDELLLNAGDKLVFSVMESGNESLLCVTAEGGSF